MNKREKAMLTVVVMITIGLLVGFGVKLKNSLEPTDTSTNPTPNASNLIEPKLAPTTLLEGLSNVWDIGFLPDGTAIFTERAGQISVLKSGKKIVLHQVANIYAVGEGGLLGLAVDPKFSENRYIYACYDTLQDIRVSRWRLNDQTNALLKQVDIISGIPVNTTTFPGRHSGCRVRFGPDGHLWVGTGDVAIGTNPQDPKSLGGKILHVDRDGKPVEGNLGEPFDPRIFSYGHRNVQGLAMLDKSNQGIYGYSIEHGSNRDDEINPIIRGNFGRDPVPGYNDQAPMTDKAKFPDAIDAIWSSGTPTIAPSGATFIKGEKWGAYKGSLVMAVLKAKHLRLFTIDKSGKVIAEKELLKDEFGRIRSVVMGPEDNMFITTDNGKSQDKIIKISPI